jgi:hypothetical protein
LKLTNYLKQILEDKLIFLSSESKVYEMSKGLQHLSRLLELHLFGAHEIFVLSVTFTICCIDGGSKFLQKTDLFLPANMASHSSILYSSQICFVMYILNDHGVSEAHHAIKISGQQKENFHSLLKFRVILLVLTLLI